MIRKIIKIDEEKCNGCELCVNACHEGAIIMKEGKATLFRDDYCDGLGDCLPVCPMGAISFEERDTLEYDEAAVKANMQQKKLEKLPCGCPGTNSKTINREYITSVNNQVHIVESHLNQWPVQMKLVPVNAPYFEQANLLISADCAAYTYGDFHAKFMKNKITLIGCPKLDEGDYSEKLTNILQANNVKSVTIVRMEVPCCGGLEYAVKNALKNCGKMIPWGVITISTDGKILD